MTTDALVRRLGQDLRPVRPRSLRRQAALLLLLALAEAGGFIALGFMRPDMPDAMHAPSFWWKLASTGVLAVLGAAVALLSLDPTRSPRRGLRWLLASIAAVFASGWAVDAARGGALPMLARLDWAHGLQCVWKMAVLSVPPAVAFGLLVRRGAPTDRTGTAAAAGLASAAWGAFVFVFACPSDDALYIAAWYAVGCGVVTACAGAVLVRLSRW